MFSLIYLTEDKAVATAAEAFLEQWRSASGVIESHTSGSTGRPKQILLPKSDMQVSARATNCRFGIDSNSTLLLPLSAGYIAGKMMLVRALEADCTLAVCGPSNRFWTDPRVAQFIASHTIHLLPVVPSQLETLLDNPHLHVILKRIENIIIGGAPLSPLHEQKLTAITLGHDSARNTKEGKSVEIPTTFYATFGMTETCSHIALRPVGCDVYTAMPSVTFSTDSEECLIIEAPDYSFGALQTNDRVTLLSPTTFRWLGRRDNVVNSGGVKLHPEAIEKKLAQHFPFPFFLKGERDGKWGECLCIVLEDSCTLPDIEIARICRDVLTAVETPRMIQRINAFRYTTSGKLLRSATAKSGCEAKPLLREATPSGAD